MYPLKDLPHNSCELLLPPLPPPSSSLSLSPAFSATLLAGLLATIANCKASGKSALWLNLSGPATFPVLPVALAAGFEFHHAEGSDASLSLWLPSHVLTGDDDTPPSASASASASALSARADAASLASKIPSFATHQVGIGSLVYHAPTSSVLVVREVGRNYTKWKLPGGLLDLGESLTDAAVREVFEETGVSGRVGGLLGFRHSLGGGQFKRDDLYFVCWMTPNEACADGHTNTGELGVATDALGRPCPKPQEGEITAAQWVPFQELSDMYRVGGSSPHPMMWKVLEMAKGVLPGREEGKGTDIQRTMIRSVVPGRKPMPFYHVEIQK